jgi:multiple antibiotic resistance protein
MAFSEITLLLFLVIDPFGTLPLVLALLRQLPEQRYRRVVLRETAAAFVLLALFAAFGDIVISRFGIAESSLHVAGGIVLFLISIRMIFHGATDVFQDDYADDPWLVPLAVPAIAGAAAFTTVLVLKTQNHVPLHVLLAALGLVFVVSLIIFVFGRKVAHVLKPRGMRAIERFMGLLLCLLAVNMTLYGIKLYFG